MWGRRMARREVMAEAVTGYFGRGKDLVEDLEAMRIWARRMAGRRRNMRGCGGG